MNEDRFKRLLSEQSAAITGQLTAYIDKRITEQKEYVDDRTNHQTITITARLIRHIDQHIKEVHGRLDIQDQRIDAVYNLVDADSKQRTTDEDERASMTIQLDRHNKWIKQIARGTGTKLAAK